MRPLDKRRKLDVKDTSNVSVSEEKMCKECIAMVKQDVLLLCKKCGSATVADFAKLEPVIKDLERGEVFDIEACPYCSGKFQFLPDDMYPAE